MGRTPRVPIRTPHTAHLLERDGPILGQKGALTGLQTCFQTLVDKNLKLVNVVHVMLIRSILPCQQWAFNLWEFDLARHQTLSRLFDTTYEYAWKVLFKGNEAPASAIEDRGFSAQRNALAVSCFFLLQGISLS